MDVKLDNFQNVYKQANFFKRLFRELLVIQRIKLSSCARGLLKYHGFSVRVNKYLCLEVSLVSDLMKTDLQRFLLRNSLSFSQKLDICLRVAEGLEELQKLKIVHGDLKPQNILIDESDNIFIGDYGTSRINPSDQTFVSGTINATIKFAAPELLLSSKLSPKVIFLVLFLLNFC